MPQLGLATLNHSPLFGLPPELDAVVAATSQAGFGYLAPDVFWLRTLREGGSPPEVVAERLEARGLGCLELAGLAIADAETTAAELSELVDYARALRPLFVNTRVLVPVAATAIEGLRRCGEALAECGARIALEYSRGTQLRSIAEARELLTKARVPGAGITVDTWHFFDCRDDWRSLAELPLDELATVQFSDGTPPPPDEWNRTGWMHETTNRRELPGDGTLDLVRFSEGPKTTANLQHPHILPLFDSGEVDSFLFYVMPYGEGESLRQRLEREKQRGSSTS